jgi:hypothetical protein
VGIRKKPPWLNGSSREAENGSDIAAAPLKFIGYSIHSKYLAHSKTLSNAMMNERPPLSALDRHAVLSGADDGFPWFAGAMLAAESSEVVRLRLAKFAAAHDDSEHEASLMVSEKIAALFEASASWLAGATPAAIIGRYREHVAANAKRLSNI